MLLLQLQRPLHGTAQEAQCSQNLSTSGFPQYRLQNPVPQESTVTLFSCPASYIPPRTVLGA